MRTKLLFLCTGNSCRSQMAEGWARHLHAGTIDAHSAGTNPHGVDPRAVRVMAEAGVDISRQTSKRPEDVPVALDVVVTVCDKAKEACPMLPGVRIIHAGFEDPPALARAETEEEAKLAHYRRVRDEIRAYVEGLPGALRSAGVQGSAR